MLLLGAGARRLRWHPSEHVGQGAAEDDEQQVHGTDGSRIAPQVAMPEGEQSDLQ